MSGVIRFRSSSGNLDSVIPHVPNSRFSDAFLQAIPKTDLHLHLDGSLRIETIIELAQKYNVALPGYTVAEMKEKVFKSHYSSLVEYLECFKYMSAVMCNEEAIERIAYELAEDNFLEGVRYFEARFAPQLLAVPGKLEIEAILVAVNNGFRRAAEKFNASNPKVVDGLEPEYAYGIIVCGMRMFTPQMSSYFSYFWEVHKGEEPHKIYGMASMALVTQAVAAKNAHKIPIVGIDIAGAEAGFPAQDHKEAFMYAHAHFLRKTVHAGEAYGPESIFQAINDCFAERIGHGFHVFNTKLVHSLKRSNQKDEFVQHLADYIADRNILMEVCMSSNLQTMPELENDPSNHNLGRMLGHKMKVSICTDNRTVSHTSVVKELRLAVDTFDMTTEELKDCIISGFRYSFMNVPFPEKNAYISKVVAMYEKLEAEYAMNGYS